VDGLTDGTRRREALAKSASQMTLNSGGDSSGSDSNNGDSTHRSPHQKINTLNNNDDSDTSRRPRVRHSSLPLGDAIAEVKEKDPYAKAMPAHTAPSPLPPQSQSPSHVSPLGSPGGEASNASSTGSAGNDATSGSGSGNARGGTSPHEVDGNEVKTFTNKYDDDYDNATPNGASPLISPRNRFIRKAATYHMSRAAPTARKRAAEIRQARLAEAKVVEEKNTAEAANKYERKRRTSIPDVIQTSYQLDASLHDNSYVITIQISSC
jgi:hypothetical protein